MEKIIPILYAEYGRYISRFRAIPYYIDVLRPVERRILLSTFEIAKNYTKSAKVLGYCMGNYHPHSDAYSTLVKLVNLGYIEGQGNFGCDGLVPSEAAASRYTEVRITKWISELAFKFIDYVEWKNFEFDKEPEFLPSPIPVGLIGNSINQGMAFHKTVVPQYDIKDLVKRLKFLIGKTKEDVIIKPVIKGHIVESSKSEIKALLKSGESKIKIITKHKKIDERNIDLLGVPIASAKNKFSKYIENNKLDVNDFSSKDITIRVTGKIDYTDFINNVLTNYVYYNILLVDNDGKVSKYGVDDILIRNYDMFTKTVKKYLENAKIKAEDKLTELMVIKEIKSVMKEHNINTTDQLIKHCKSDPELVKKVISKYTINTLVNLKVDLDKQKEEIDNIKNKLNNLDNEVYTYLENVESLVM
ncbi:MAG: DNA gyrase subunit A [Nanopusillaceae archaeon]